MDASGRLGKCYTQAELLLAVTCFPQAGGLNVLFHKALAPVCLGASIPVTGPNFDVCYPDLTREAM